jgi:iron complex outermembrane receptor protein
VNCVFWYPDLAWKLDLAGNWFVDGALSMADGRRTDVDDYLYQLAPPNTSVGSTYDADSWSIKTEVIFNAKQDRVSQFNGEQESSSYELVNIGFAWNPIASLRLEARVENLLDETYQDHLAGVNRAAGGDIPQGISLYGIERTFTAGLIYQF